ncbi:MAG: methyltransferase domain-containing protein, partial [Lachnospiraceae bacterium]|nr:methyltransferase domain-containing protein [Lachnospiraceae bacterium]
MKKNDEFTLEIIDLAEDGSGVGKTPLPHSPAPASPPGHGHHITSTDAAPITDKASPGIKDAGIKDASVDGAGIPDATPIPSSGFTWFVKDALPGDVALVRAMKQKKHYGYAKLVRLVTPSPFRIEAPCPVAGSCGGCQLQGLAYVKQLGYKASKVLQHLLRIGRFSDEEIAGMIGAGASATHAVRHATLPDVPVASMGRGADSSPSGGPPASDEPCPSALPVIGMANPYRYRNKAQVPFAADKNGKIIYGFYAGRTHTLIKQTDCLLQPAINRDILSKVKQYMEECHVRPYDESTHTGLVRHCLIRSADTVKCDHPHVTHIGNKPSAEPHVAVPNMAVPNVAVPNVAAPYANIDATDLTHASGIAQTVGKESHTALITSDVCLVINGKRLPHSSRLVELLLGIPGITGISYCINEARTNVILGESVIPIYGDGRLTDRIGGVTYRISPLSFYQVNPTQTEKLYATVLEFSGLGAHPGDTATAAADMLSGPPSHPDYKDPVVIWDLYCGIGTISLYLARHSIRPCRIYGIEVSESAVADARENARLNGIANATFVVGRAEDILPGLPTDEAPPFPAHTISTPATDTAAPHVPPAPDAPPDPPPSTPPGTVAPVTAGPHVPPAPDAPPPPPPTTPPRPNP